MASGASGLLLCGGQSRRMGFDKARIELAGAVARPGEGGRESLLARAARVLEEVCDELLVASGPERRYTDLIAPGRTRRWVLDAHAKAADTTCEVESGRGPGPLAGLLAGLEAARNEYVVAVACDMPGVSAALLRALLERARAERLDVCLASAPAAEGAARPADALAAGVQPLLGVYRTSVAPALRAALGGGRLRLVDFHAERLPDGRLPRVGVLTLDPEGAAPGTPRAVWNLNTVEDLERWTAGAYRPGQDPANGPRCTR